MSAVALLMAASGRFICDFDPGGLTDSGGFVPTTEDVSQAKHFDGAEAAIAFWRTQSRVVPLRDDGKANRPLTGFTVQILKVPEVAASAPDATPEDDGLRLAGVVSENVSPEMIAAVHDAVRPMVVALLRLEPEVRYHVMGSLLSSWAFSVEDKDPRAAFVDLASDVAATLPEAIKQVGRKPS